MLKLKLNYQDQFDRGGSVIKQRQENDMTDHIGAIFVKNNTEVS